MGPPAAPWFTVYTTTPPPPTSETTMPPTKFKFDPAKVQDVFTSAPPPPPPTKSNTTEERAATFHPLAVGQVWRQRNGVTVRIVSHQSGTNLFLSDESWEYGPMYQAGRTDAWYLAASGPNAEDLVALISTPTTKEKENEKEKEKEETAATEPETSTPHGALEERVVELIHAHSSKVDMAVVKDLVKQAAAEHAPASVRIEIPALKIDHTEENVHEQFPTLLDLIANGERVFLSGPPGSGKTTATEKCAEILKRPFFIQGPVADEFRLTGFVDAHGNFQPTEVYRWATTPDAVLMLDEVDGSFPQPLLFLNMALANGYIAFPGKGKIEIPRTNTVVANGNTWGGGADFDFVGRSKLDAAFVNRFPAKLSWDYDHKFETALALSANGGKKEWVRVMHQIRDNARKNGIKVHVTPRDTFFYCRCRARGWTHEKALNTGLLSTCKPEQRAKLLVGVTDDT